MTEKSDSPRMSLAHQISVQRCYMNAVKKGVLKFGDYKATKLQKMSEKRLIDEMNKIDEEMIEILSDEEIINRINNSGMYEYFMNLWKENYVKLASVGKKIRSVDMDTYLLGLRNVIKYHLASEGLK